jgi:hypothetical protein
MSDDEFAQAMDAGFKRSARAAALRPLVASMADLPPDSTLGQAAERLMRQFPVCSVDALLDRKPPATLVRGVLWARGLHLLAGESGGGKTHLALSLSCAVCRNAPFFGRRTKAGRVVLVNAEGDISTRLRAHLKHHELEPADLRNLRVIDRAFRLTDDEDRFALIERLRIEEETGGPIALVVVDTLSRVLVGADENSALDMGNAVAGLQEIEQAFDCAVLVVHHLGKDKGRGPRGHSSLYAAADVILSVERAGDVRTLTATKMRDASDGDTLLTFRLQSVDLGAVLELDPESGADPGERFTSCVVVQAEDEAPRPAQPKPMGRVQRAVLDVLKAAGTPQTRAQLVQLLGQNGVTNRSSIYSAIDALLRAGLVTEGLDRLYVGDA